MSLPRSVQELVQRRSSFEFYSRGFSGILLVVGVAGFCAGALLAMTMLSLSEPYEQCERDAKAAKVLRQIVRESHIPIGSEPARER